MSRAHSSQTPSLFEEEFSRISWQLTADRCRRCGSTLFKAICRTGFAIRLEVDPITPGYDLECFNNRWHTYRLWHTYQGFEIELRTPEKILTQSADEINLAAHRCGSSQVTLEWPDLEKVYRERRSR